MVCGDGLCVFMLCTDGKSVVLECDECGAVWLDPRRFDASDVFFPSEPDFSIPIEGCSMLRPNVSAASRAEVEGAGLGDMIAGEGKAMWEDDQHSNR